MSWAAPGSHWYGLACASPWWAWMTEIKIRELISNKVAMWMRIPSFSGIGINGHMMGMDSYLSVLAGTLRFIRGLGWVGRCPCNRGGSGFLHAISRHDASNREEIGEAMGRVVISDDQCGGCSPALTPERVYHCVSRAAGSASIYTPLCCSPFVWNLLCILSHTRLSQSAPGARPHCAVIGYDAPSSLPPSLDFPPPHTRRLPVTRLAHTRDQGWQWSKAQGLGYSAGHRGLSKARRIPGTVLCTWGECVHPPVLPRDAGNTCHNCCRTSWQRSFSPMNSCMLWRRLGKEQKRNRSTIIIIMMMLIIIMMVIFTVIMITIVLFKHFTFQPNWLHPDRQ